jgi:transposase
MRKSQPFSENARAVVATYVKTAKTVSSFKRVLCLWLRITQGLTPDQIADSIGWHVASVRRIQLLFMKDGTSCLNGVVRGGRRRENLSRKEEAELLAPFVHRAKCGIKAEVKAIHQAYERRLQRKVPKSTIYRMIARHDVQRLFVEPRARQLRASLESS